MTQILSESFFIGIQGGFGFVSGEKTGHEVQAG